MTVTTETRPTLPAVDCAPWCQDGDGHTDALHVEDQWCTSDTATDIELTAEPLERFDGKIVGRAWVRAYLGREAYSTRTLVHVVHNEAAALLMTVDEAIELGEVLIRLGRQAQA